MWRVQGFVGRVLHRYHGSNPLRLPQNQGQSQGLGDAEIINNSVVLSTSQHSSDGSSQKEEDGERRKKRRSFHLGFAELPRYTALDAVGWGAAAVLFMQICRRIHSKFSSNSEPSPIPGALTAPATLHKCGYRILLEILSRRDVLPRGRTVLCLQEGPERQTQAQSSSSSISSSGDAGLDSSSEPVHLTADCSICDQQRALLNQDCLIPEESPVSASCPLQNEADRDNTETTDAKDEDMLSDEERLAGAALNLRHVGDNSIPVILNIIGLESAKSENYEEAFTCFVAAAQQGYSKAQFNTAVCYEKGRGVVKDRDKARIQTLCFPECFLILTHIILTSLLCEKPVLRGFPVCFLFQALYHYWQAAAGGHRQAQYRHAKLLLTSRGCQSVEQLNTAIHLLEQAAAAGLSKAQVCLASVYTRESVRDGSRSVHYLKMAAESGDNTALLFLGQCFESGFGVQQNLRMAVEYYKRAAQAGNKQAQSLLTPLEDELAEDAVLRCIRSAPCFSAADRRLQQPLSPPSSGRPITLPLLPHSWSTGSLCVPPALSSTPLHLHPQSTEGGACQWTVGVG
ncbi:death ligand signal enhancer isoform X2 [Anarrhichthys ocellatus]|uniref:death ligand signal enhancer isoform X2 n=1 Tax=Anarrhichthys ocellatus TaxID=433405 RepID=UPI0012EE68AA|nr:death ligand signal enhancer isoform X2 [Anarrhichthys ocellatus]